MEPIMTLEQAQAIPAIPVPQARPIASVRFDEERDEIDGGPTWVVEARWIGAGADSDYALAWSVGAKKERLARRLAAAIDAGAVFETPAIRTNIYGQTYVSAGTRVFGRHLNADLKRLGY